MPAAGKCWFDDPTKPWPNGLAGTHFADPNLAECAVREVIVPPLRDGDDIFMHTKELSRSIKLVLDADHDYSSTFQPIGNKDIPHTGADMGPQLMGLYAEKTTGERDKTGKLEVIGDIFIPLSAIVLHADICTFAHSARCVLAPQFLILQRALLYAAVDCDRDKFPCFYDHSPNVVNLKTQLAKPIARSVDKEKDYAFGFKAYISGIRRMTFTFAVILILVHSVVAVLVHTYLSPYGYGAPYDFAAATLATVELAYCPLTNGLLSFVIARPRWGLAYIWVSRRSKLKKWWTEKYLIHREYWRWKKDDEVARQFNYNFPGLVHLPIVPSVR